MPASTQSADDAVTRATKEVLPQVAQDLDDDVTPEEAAARVARALGREGAAPPIVLLDGLEVVQEVQDLEHSVSLVAGKSTVVRAYLQYTGGPVTVRGELGVASTRAGPWRTVPSLSTAALDPARAGDTPAALRTRRADLGTSLNFVLPAELTAVGDLWLRVGVVTDADTGLPLPSVAFAVRTVVTFVPGVPLRLRLVSVRYAMEGSTTTFVPSATDIAHLVSWLRRAYPVPSVEVTTTTVDAIPVPPPPDATDDPPHPFEAADVNAQLLALRAVDVATGTDPRTHYYGLVADGGFFMRGRASDVPDAPAPGTVASGPTGPGTWGWDFDGSYGDWYGAHELGHTFGRPHAEFCGAGAGAPYPFPDGQLSDEDGAFVGLDVGDPALALLPRALPGTVAHDVMSYCADQWLSSFTYGAIHRRLLEEDAMTAGDGAGPDARAFAGDTAPAVLVIASINLTRGTGAISAVLPGVDAAGAGATPGAGPEAVTIRLLGADGGVLDERSVPVRRSACEEPDDDVTGVVEAVVPASPDVATVAIVRDGTVVDAVAVGGAPAASASLERAAPVAGASAGGAGVVASSPSGLDLRWDVSGAAGSERYIVQVSDDDGGNWRTVAVGLVEPAVTLSAADYAADEVDVRLLSTTGRSTVVADARRVSLR